jgi:hypothetical protein
MKARQDSKASTKDFVNSQYAIEMVDLGQSHIRYITFHFYRIRVENGSIKCFNLNKALTYLCALFGLNVLNNDAKAVTQSGYFTNERPFFNFILDAIKILLKNIRPQALNIVESLNIPDFFLQSAIGNSYGDIYETHLEWARDSNMNKSKLGDAIPEGFM